jgi:diacylglycerol kinase (ATP)
VRGHAECLAREAAGRGEPMVVAAGGDGTIAEVANGLMGSGARLGVIPLGTANVLAHELALPFAPKAVAAALAFGRTRTLWPGMASRPDGDRLFVQMLGYRLRRACGEARVVSDETTASARALTCCARCGTDAIFVSANPRAAGRGRNAGGQRHRQSKGRLYGGRFRLAADAVPGEPGFSVVLFDRGGPWSAMMYGAALPLNLLGHAPGVRRIRANRVDFIGNEPVPAQTDGDPAGMRGHCR